MEMFLLVELANKDSITNGKVLDNIFWIRKLYIA